MAEKRDPASDQMKIWKEQRAAQVHSALSESWASASKQPWLPQRSEVPGAVPLIRGGGMELGSCFSFQMELHSRG